MAEEDTKEENKPKEPFPEKEEPTDESTVGLVDEANRVTDRYQRENDRREQILIREERLHVQRNLGGVSQAGKQVEKPKEETPKEYMKRVMRNEV